MRIAGDITATARANTLLPNDEVEQDHLDLVHHICRILVGCDLYHPPPVEGEPPPRRILNLNTGAGI